MSKIKNFINNYKRYGFIGVTMFYIKNLIFGEQVAFNTIKLIKILIKKW